ncbi:MAG TPA: hypothetical protein VN026_15810 [Bacteroidia bacterium]|jgi:hypothetical protein|nr:hypothetical protein [Bacteroidia bacterium]
MKKIFILFGIFTLLAMVSSCKKDHVCGCVGTSTEPGTTRTITYITFTNAKRSDAKKACIKTTSNYTSTVDGQTYVNTTDCALKD